MENCSFYLILMGSSLFVLFEKVCNGIFIHSDGNNLHSVQESANYC